MCRESIRGRERVKGREKVRGRGRVRGREKLRGKEGGSLKSTEAKYLASAARN